MAVMVWCQSCKKVVWAYDQYPPTDLRGICNTLHLPCPSCGDIGNFNGWSDRLPYSELKANILQRSPEARIVDYWTIMKYIAEQEKVSWEPSGDNSWFPKELNSYFRSVIRKEVTY